MPDMNGYRLIMFMNFRAMLGNLALYVTYGVIDLLNKFLTGLKKLAYYKNPIRIL